MLRDNCAGAEGYGVDLVSREEEAGIGLGVGGVGRHIAADNNHGIENREHGGQAVEVGGSCLNIAVHLGQFDVEGTHGLDNAV